MYSEIKCPHIYWFADGPRLVFVEPVESYYPYDTIKIWADSNPHIYIWKWFNTATNEILGTSDTITITPSMLGHNSIKVTLCNTLPLSPIKSVCKEHHLNITVISKWICISCVKE